MKKFCASLREHAVEIINFEQKKVIPLRNSEYKSYVNQKTRICKEKFKDKFVDDKKYC